MAALDRLLYLKLALWNSQVLCLPVRSYSCSYFEVEREREACVYEGSSCDL